MFFIYWNDFYVFEFKGGVFDLGLVISFVFFGFYEWFIDENVIS